MHIRFATPEDAAALLSIYRPYVERSAATFEIETPTAQEFAARIRAVQADGFAYLAAEEDGRALGYCYASPFARRAAYRPSVDLSLYLAPECHRRHAGLALYTCALRLLSAQGYESAFGVVTASNAPSRALHERMGFRLVGTLEKVGYKLDAWHDVCYYELSLGARPVPPRPIRPVGDLEKAFVDEVLRDGEARVLPKE